MPVDHSKHGFLKDISTDWVALAANGEPLARAATEDGVVRAAPHAAHYITGKPVKAKALEPVVATEPVKEEPVKEEPEPVKETPESVNPAMDHDGDGRMGGSEKGENATASKSRRKRKPAD